MHEQMHERTSEKGEEDEYAPDVSPMFGEQKRTGDHDEADQNEPRSGGQKVASRLILVVRVTVQRHCVLLLDNSPVRNSIRCRRHGLE
jgi:hypothetical protein